MLSLWNVLLSKTVNFCQTGGQAYFTFTERMSTTLTFTSSDPNSGLATLHKCILKIGIFSKKCRIRDWLSYSKYFCLHGELQLSSMETEVVSFQAIFITLLFLQITRVNVNWSPCFCHSEKPWKWHTAKINARKLLQNWDSYLQQISIPKDLFIPCVFS